MGAEISGKGSLLDPDNSCQNTFLAPPAGRHRSFSNADSSVCGLNFSIKILISQKRPDNFGVQLP